MLRIVAVGLLLVAGATADNSWTSAGTKDGVTLAFRDDPALAAREVRATTELPFPAQRIFDLVCDLSQYQTLVPGVQEARLISGTTPVDYEIYFRYSPRFLVVAARDVVVRVREESRPSVLGCRWEEVSERMAHQPNAVRMRLLRGSWTLEAIEPSRTRVTYQVAANPGGRLPGWLVRRGAASAVPEVIQQVRAQLVKRP
jgi:ribosome-associated toxin RatA of RatAB toxin-antitoxin module